MQVKWKKSSTAGLILANIGWIGQFSRGRQETILLSGCVCMSVKPSVDNKDFYSVSFGGRNLKNTNNSS